MTDLAAFFDRYQDQKPSMPSLAPGSDAELRAASDLITPMYGRIAERGGFTLDDLQDQSFALMEGTAKTALAFAVQPGHNVLEAMRYAAASGHLDGFMAGVLWEQERHLPALDLEG